MCDVCGCGPVEPARHEDAHAHAHAEHEHEAHDHGMPRPEPEHEAHASPEASHAPARSPGAHAERVSLELGASLLAKNDRDAAHLRAHFVASKVLALNLMGSPGSGKTALLEATARAFAGGTVAGKRWRLAAVSGDLATALDAERLARAGIVSAPITTGTACHLDAAMVHEALHDARLAGALREADVFFIENVGNLVCPAVYDVGQAANVVVLSVTEGVDKPLKYPVMFRKADLVVLTKIDLLPHLPGVSLEALTENVARVMPAPKVLPVSPLTGAGMEAFIAWLAERREAPPHASARSARITSRAL